MSLYNQCGFCNTQSALCSIRLLQLRLVLMQKNKVMLFSMQRACWQCFPLSGHFYWNNDLINTTKHLHEKVTHRIVHWRHLICKSIPALLFIYQIRCCINSLVSEALNRNQKTFCFSAPSSWNTSQTDLQASELTSLVDVTGCEKDFVKLSLGACSCFSVIM